MVTGTGLYTGDHRSHEGSRLAQSLELEKTRKASLDRASALSKSLKKDKFKTGRTEGDLCTPWDIGRPEPSQEVRSGFGGVRSTSQDRWQEAPGSGYSPWGVHPQSACSVLPQGQPSSWLFGPLVSHPLRLRDPGPHVSNIFFPIQQCLECFSKALLGN